MRHSKLNRIVPRPGRCGLLTAPHRRSWKQHLPYTGTESVYLLLLKFRQFFVGWVERTTTARRYEHKKTYPFGDTTVSEKQRETQHPQLDQSATGADTSEVGFHSRLQNNAFRGFSQLLDCWNVWGGGVQPNLRAASCRVWKLDLQA